MRICLVSQQYPPDTARGGLGTQTWNKATALARRGHTVHVISRATGAGPSRSTQGDGRVTVHRLHCPATAPGETYEEAVYWMRYTWAVLRELQELMRTVELDVVNFPEWGAEGFAYLLDRPRGRRVPAVVHLHGPLAMFSEHLGWPERGSLLHRVGTTMEDLSIELADGLMASSAHIADFTAGRYGRERASIDVVHTGIDGEVFRPPARRTETGGRPTVLFVGNIAHNKGIETLFEAVLRLRVRYPDILLRIVGSGHEHLVGDLHRRAQLACAGANVEFCGFVPRDRLPDVYGSAHVFASPAQYEFGVANVYIEAMACGCPVIASSAGGAPEAVVHDETGLLVPPNDIGAVVAALDRILSDAPLGRRMGDAARRRVEEYFTLDRYIVRVLGAYEKAIERATASI